MFELEEKRYLDGRSAAAPRRKGERATDVWLTPPAILAALGQFDLDPCAAQEPRPWPTARAHIALPRDGLKEPWAGRVWLNPPYGTNTATWLARLASHGNGIALVFARTETAMFFESVWGVASGILFLRGRVTFHSHDGKMAPRNAGAPSVLLAYGEENAENLRASSMGHYLARP